jgi:protein-tyrosine-phosphatase
MARYNVLFLCTGNSARSSQRANSIGMSESPSCWRMISPTTASAVSPSSYNKRRNSRLA